ncbi:hypothetical protein B0H13DRAFT_1867295 [Mycena leptocephala]|nr:hypothetical protein B0H13DRAFT_1867295 [Mycena leptocephala]
MLTSPTRLLVLFATTLLASKVGAATLEERDPDCCSFQGSCVPAGHTSVALETTARPGRRCICAPLSTWTTSPNSFRPKTVNIVRADAGCVSSVVSSMKSRVLNEPHTVGLDFMNLW